MCEVQSLRLAFSLAAQLGASAGVRAVPLIVETAPLAAAAARAGGMCSEAAALWQAVMHTAAAWHGARWGEFLKRADQLPRGSSCSSARACELVQGLLSRCVPYARAGLLSALNDAVLARLSFPASALALHLRIRTRVGAAREPAWLRAATFAARLGVGVRDANGLRIAVADVHAALAAAQAAGATDVSLAFDKAAPVSPSVGALSDITPAALERRVVLTPSRDRIDCSPANLATACNDNAEGGAFSNYLFDA